MSILRARLKKKKVKSKVVKNKTAKKKTTTKKKKSKLKVFDFWRNVIVNLEKTGKIGNSKAYANTFSVFKQFREQKDISFKKLNYKTLIEFESFLLKRGLKTNGISFHLRTLRAMYNRAINSDVASINNYPFKKYKIKNEKTVHRAISKDELKRIKNHKSDDKSVDFAKDCFMFSFYTRGMSFIDLANLKHENIHENSLQYRRSKTGQPFTIKLTDNAQAIIEKYANLNTNNSYIFPIIKLENRKYTQYRNALTLVNKKLKIIGKSTNCSIPLTTYVARHSWATIAKHDGVSTSIISEGLGHTTEHTTQIYLDSFGNDIIDKANDIITDLG